MCGERERGHMNTTVMYESGWPSGDEEREARRGEEKEKERLCCPMMKGLID